MDSKKILDADFLDLLFEGKNKDYGAYDLRKTYNRRLTKAMMGTAAIILFLFAGYFLSNLNAAPAKQAVAATDFVLDEVKTVKKEDPIVIPPKPEPLKMKTIQFTPPKLVKEDVPADEKPPVQEDLTDTKIGTVNMDGARDEGVTAPPVSDGGKGIVEAPKKVDEDLPFIKVEKESEYPGGIQAWIRFLQKNLRVPDEAINNGIKGRIVVQFIVDREGNVSDVHAISGPEEGGLRQEAERVIRKSGKWTPAIQNGNKVKSYKSQPIVIELGDQ